jgi:NtrC-family two-component system sensor histidine kinase KinB
VSVRTKLLLAQAPLLLALVAIAVVGSFTASELGRGAQTILRENYRSVVEMQRIVDALDRLDRLALSQGSPEAPSEAAEAPGLQEDVEQALAAQRRNVTEPGEADATAALDASWLRYRARFAAFRELRDPAAARTAYFADLLPAFDAVKRHTGEILVLNQDAMLRKSDAAERSARRLNTVLVAVALGGCLLGVLGSSALTTRLLRPLSVLSQAARRLGEGDVEARARVDGGDELAQLAVEFNTMAERLKRYRESTLGELLAAHRSSQAVIDSLPDPVLVVAVEGHLLHVNESAQRLLRIRLDAGLGSLDAAVRAVLERVRQHVLSGKGAYLPTGLEEAARIETIDGERRLLPRGTPVYSEQGDVVGTTVVLQDVTRLLTFEELKNDLVATVAHEFRTPLTSLHMSIHLLTEQLVGPLTEKQSDLVYAAREDCERLQRIVEDLLDLSRIESGRLVLRRLPLAIEPLGRASLGTQGTNAEQRGVTLRCEVVPGPERVLADPDRIQLVFSNLLANAIRHSPAGGQVTLRASIVDGSARFDVIDQGPGIPPELRDAVFEKYFRAPGSDGHGAGLGLSIAREIVQAHGGAIGVASGPDGGSRFWFTLPLAD